MTPDKSSITAKPTVTVAGKDVVLDFAGHGHFVYVPSGDYLDTYDIADPAHPIRHYVSNIFGKPDRRVFFTDPTPGQRVKRGSGVNLYTK